MSIFKPLSMYAVKNDPNIVADITFYQDGEIVHHETIVKNKKRFYNNHESFVKNNVLTLNQIEKGWNMPKDKQLSKHPLMGWISLRYAKITFIPAIMYLSSHINKLMDIIQDTTHKFDPSFIVQPQDQTLKQSQPVVHIYDNMTNILTYITFGVAILAFIYASSFTMALIYHKTKLDTEYRVLDSHNIEAYKEDVDKLTPVLFWILLVASIMYSKMG